MAATPPCRRVRNTVDMLEIVAERVVKGLSEKKFAQCFPLYQERYPELMKALKARVEDIYREGVKKAIEISVNQFDFVERTNAFDAIVDRAEETKRLGAPPRMLFLKGADATITVPTVTVPELRAATALLREKRLEVERRNGETYAALARDQVVVDRTERQILEILDHFQQAIDVLESADDDRMRELQQRMVDAMPDEV
ncbi:hypothetical protein RQP46_001381 [Phenoliferia psychrophenolica]